MALKKKITDAIKKARPFLMQVSEDASADTALKELEAVLQALETHKGSADHDNDPHNWSAPNEFAQAVKVAGLLPKGETADIGTPKGIFRIAYISELVTFLLRRENVLVMDGTMVITKQSGKFPDAVASTDTQIDFGQTLTVGDFLLLRAEGQQEYMRIGTKVDGTIYNVTRDLDGTGANDWPAESVYFVRGHQGDGWLELTATDDQRFSVFVQGANWNQFTEIGRFGKLDGWQGAGLTGYGIAIGDYANNECMYYETVTGKSFVSGEMQAANGKTTLDEGGLTFTAGASLISFYSGLGVLLARISYLPHPSNPGVGTLELSGKTGARLNFLDEAQAGTVDLQADKLSLYHPYRVFIESPYLKLNNAEIKTTPTANAIPKADATGKLDAGWLPPPLMLGLKRRSAQNIAPNSWRAIYWSSTTDYDTGFSFAGGQAVDIPSDGVYRMTGYIGLAGSTAALTTIGIYVNDELYPRLQNNVATNSQGTHGNIAGTLLLSAGDKVYLKIYHNHNATLQTLTVTLPSFDIERVGRIPSGVGTLAGEKGVKGE